MNGIEVRALPENAAAAVQALIDLFWASGQVAAPIVSGAAPDGVLVFALSPKTKPAGASKQVFRISDLAVDYTRGVLFSNHAVLGQNGMVVDSSGKSWFWGCSK